MQFHILAFEGPDAYARAGGIASRVTGLSQALAAAGFDTHVWFVDDPALPGHDTTSQKLRATPAHERALRQTGRVTARRFAWPQIIQSMLLPRIHLLGGTPPPRRRRCSIARLRRSV